MFILWFHAPNEPPQILILSSIEADRKQATMVFVWVPVLNRGNQEVENECNDWFCFLVFQKMLDMLKARMLQ